MDIGRCGVWSSWAVFAVMSKRKWWPRGKTQKREKELTEQIKLARHYLTRVAEGYKIGSVNTDVDYGNAFDALEKVYQLAEIGELAEDNRTRLERERRGRKDSQNDRT